MSRNLSQSHESFALIACLLVPFSVPVWELASELECLSLETRSEVIWPGIMDDGGKILAVTDEAWEEESGLVKDERSLFYNRRLAAHYSVMYRIIAAAARGGKLRRLFIPEPAIQRPFAVRALVPFWVNVEVWHVMGVNARPISTPAKAWSDAASALRPALHHASTWLPESATGARSDRRLTLEDVQSLYALFTPPAYASTPDFTGEQQVYQTHVALLSAAPTPVHGQPLFGHSLVNLYLPWLVEDASLAQQVADAWNAVVAQKEADKVKCRCERCNVLHVQGTVKCRCQWCPMREQSRGKSL